MHFKKQNAQSCSRFFFIPYDTHHLETIYLFISPCRSFYGVTPQEQGGVRGHLFTPISLGIALMVHSHLMLSQCEVKI
jgi:hypothetical protein